MICLCPVAAAPAPAPHVVVDALSVWVGSPAAAAVLGCESGGLDTAVSPSGLYRGRWQIGEPFWLAYGGDPGVLPDRAPRRVQDQVAYAGWLARGWRPWECAQLVGVLP